MPPARTTSAEKRSRKPNKAAEVDEDTSSPGSDTNMDEVPSRTGSNRSATNGRSPRSTSKAVINKKNAPTDADARIINEIASVVASNRNTNNLASLSKDDLVKKLKTLAPLLSTYASPTMPEPCNARHPMVVSAMKSLSEELISKPLVKMAQQASKTASESTTNRPPTVGEECTALLASCIADVLRITAPNSPYALSAAKVVWTHVLLPALVQLRRVNHPLYMRYYHVIETISIDVVSLPLAVHEMVEEIVALIDTLFEVYDNENLSSKLEVTIETLIRTFITFFGQDTPVVIVDTILKYLDTHARRNNERKPDLAIKLLQRNETLSRPVCNIARQVYVDGMLSQSIGEEPVDKKQKKGGRKKKQRGATTSDDEAGDSDDETSSAKHVINSDTVDTSIAKLPFERQLHILYELLAHCPKLLTPIKYDLDELILCPDSKKRVAYVEMYGLLLTRQGIADEGDHEHLLHEYIKRFNDVDVTVRKTVCSHSAALLILHQNHRMEICKHLSEISQHARYDLRSAALDAIITAAKTQIDTVSDKCLNSVGRAAIDIHRAVPSLGD